MLRGLNVGVTVSKATLKFHGSTMGSMRTFFAVNRANCLVEKKIIIKMSVLRKMNI